MLDETLILSVIQRSQEEQKQHKLWYEQSQIPPPGDRKVSVLFMEADGIYIHLQREQQKHYAIAYEGWQILNDGSYGLVNKRVYSRGNEDISFWQGAGLEFDKYWDFSHIQLIVLGGDDADWINAGKEEMGYCIRQLFYAHADKVGRMEMTYMQRYEKD